VANSVGQVTKDRDLALPDSPFAAGTGIGSWPGTSAREAAEIVVGELHRLPHLVELPARGLGADLIGRASALLVDITIDTVPRGYRIAAGRSAVSRRAASLLAEDIDALEEAWEKAGLRGAERTVKVQAPGPVTLAAQLELSGGHRAITDPGALRDLARSLAEGVAAHRAEVARRLECRVVVQFDEPSLPAALAGRLTGVSALSPVHPVDEPVAAALIDECASVVGGEDSHGGFAEVAAVGGLPFVVGFDQHGSRHPPQRVGVGEQIDDIGAVPHPFLVSRSSGSVALKSARRASLAHWLNAMR